MKNLLYLVLLGCVAYGVYYFATKDKTNTLSNNALTDFAIADTSNIGKVVIDDGRNKVSLTRRDDGFWNLNDDMIAMPHHIDVIMKTFANTHIQSPVSKGQKQQVMKIILGDTRKVEIYDLEGKWIKTWYVGRATQTNQGTYALLETPEDGRSSEPFVLEMRGFRGYLTTRFHAIINDWRWTGLFHYPNLDFKKVRVETPRLPQFGYSIEVVDKLNAAFTMHDYQGNEVQKAKSSIASFLGGFKKINVEHFNVDYSPAKRDSLLATKPDFRISVIDDEGDEKSADIWYREPPEALAERMGDRTPEKDPERVLVWFDGDLAYGQRIVFDRILHVIDEF